MMQKADKFQQLYCVSEKQYNGFINIFEDRNPLHTDRDFAAAHGMKDKVMHGNILNGFLSHFIGERLPVKNVIIHSQSIVFNRPVYLDDRLVLDAEITEFYESVNAYVFKFTFKNASGDKVARGAIQVGLI